MAARGLARLVRSRPPTSNPRPAPGESRPGGEQQIDRAANNNDVGSPCGEHGGQQPGAADGEEHAEEQPVTKRQNDGEADPVERASTPHGDPEWQRDEGHHERYEGEGDFSLELY